MRQLEELKHAAVADVYKKGEPAATLTRDSMGGVTFQYRPDYSGPSVATTLPLSRTPVESRNGAVPAFFAGLLPEGYRLNLLSRTVKTSLNDELSLLLAVGEDLPGDVQIVPAGKVPEQSGVLAYGAPEDQDFTQLVHQVDPAALPGVQEKASAQMMTAPTQIQGLPGLVKISPSRYPALVLNEHLHLLAAQRLKIPVAVHRIVHDKNGEPGLFVERFDRFPLGDGWGRLALEDASQVLGIHPAQKYSPTSEEVVEVLASRTQAPLLAARTLYLQFLYAWLTGNGDLHAKNVSILERGNGGFEVSPMYDVPCTYVYGDHSMALTVDGRSTRLKKRNWEAFGAEIGLTEPAVRSAFKRALTAAAAVEWSRLPFEGSVLNGVQRELRTRRYELEK